MHHEEYTASDIKAILFFQSIAMYVCKAPFNVSPAFKNNVMMATFSFIRGESDLIEG